jgi:hypothetical protein
MRNKKEFWFFVGGCLAILLFGVGLAMAAIHGPNECCKLDHDLTDIDGACSKDAVVAAKGCDEFTCSDGNDSTCDDNVCNCPSVGMTCDEDGFKCWCDTDGDGVNNAPCLISASNITKNWGTCCVVDTVYNITDWLFYILIAAIAILFIIAGFLFLTAGGDPSKISKSKTMVLYGLIGLALALLARIIPAIIKGIVS